MDAEIPRAPTWVKTSTPPKPWIDLTGALPWLKPRPFMMKRGYVSELMNTLRTQGFITIEATFSNSPEGPERAFLAELSRRLQFDKLAAENWSVFNDRLWDYLSSDDTTPVAVVMTGLDSLRLVDTYGLVRCIHSLLSLTEGAGLADSAANRQIEYFFPGEWSRSDCE